MKTPAQKLIAVIEEVKNECQKSIEMRTTNNRNQHSEYGYSF